MNRRRRYLSHLAKAMSLGLVVVLVVLFYYVNTLQGVAPLKREAVAYSLYRNATEVPFFLCLCASPLGILISIFHWIIWRKKSIAFALTIISLFVASRLQSTSFSILVPQVFGRYRHHDTLTTYEHLYHLASEWKVGVGSASVAVYLLWECDSSDTMCSIVESERIPPIFLEQDYQNSTATLEMDNETQHIKMIINARDEVISTEYHPPDE